MSGKTGTYRFMAPEVWAESATYTAKVDVFSATLVMWFMLTGDLPFASVPTEVIALMMSREQLRPPLREFEKYPALVELFKRGWAQLEDDRATSRQMITALEPLLAHEAAKQDKKDNSRLRQMGSSLKNLLTGGSKKNLLKPTGSVRSMSSAGSNTSSEHGGSFRVRHDAAITNFENGQFISSAPGSRRPSFCSNDKSDGDAVEVAEQVARQPSPFERAHSNESYHWQRAGAFGDAAGNSQHDRFKRPSFSSLPRTDTDSSGSSTVLRTARRDGNDGDVHSEPGDSSKNEDDELLPSVLFQGSQVGAGATTMRQPRDPIAPTRTF